MAPADVPPSAHPPARLETISCEWVTSLRGVLTDASAVGRLDGFDIKSRIKGWEAIQRKRDRLSRAGEDAYVNDLVGIRVLTTDLAAVPAAVALIGAWAKRAGFREREIDDRVTFPGRGGYRAVHLDFSHRSLDVREGVPGGLEVQVSSYLLNAHRKLLHDLLYKRDLSADDSLDGQLTAVGDELAALDRRITDVLARRRHATKAR